MSEAKELNLLEQIKAQYAQFIAQRDQIQINFQQLVGAIAACEMMIKQHEEQNLMKEAEQLLSKTLEKQEHGETVEQKQEQVA
jgi:hypothetical protein